MFIVIEGLDGAGKSTQVSLIRQELKKRGIESEYLHFPRFESPIYGELIAKFLRGELGALDEVNPYIVALLYAGDRKDASLMISNWINEGKYVIVDRYVYSNIAYQCAKCVDDNKKDELRDWILNLEYEYNNIIRPDISLFLDVPFRFTETSLSKNREGGDRDYLNGKKDIHEASLDFQRNVRDVYLKQAETDKSFMVIDCSDGIDNMLPAEKIFDKIISLIL